MSRIHKASRYNAAILLMGLSSGLLGGPWVLGRAAPHLYQQLFIGGWTHQERLTAFDAHHQKQRRRITRSGATAAALTEFDQQNQPERRLLVVELQLARQIYANRVQGTLIALLLTAVMILVTELRFTQPWLRERLATARSALLAVWIAWVLAAGGGKFPMAFTAMLLFVALTAALVPVGRPKSDPSSSA